MMLVYCLNYGVKILLIISIILVFLLSPGNLWHHEGASGEGNGVFFAFYDFGELSYQVLGVHLVCQVDISVDGGDVFEDSQSEGGVPGHGELDHLVGHGSSHVPGEAVGAPVGSLAGNVEVHLAVPGSAEVEVGLVHLPVEVGVEVSPGSLDLSSDAVLQEESLGLTGVVGEFSLPGDLGLNPVAVSHGDLGLEGVVGEGVVATAELLSVDLDLSLVTAASPGDFESLELLAIGLNLQQLPGVVVDGDLALVHVRVDLVQENGHVERHLVGFVVGGQQGLHHGLAVLLDLALHVELVEQNISLVLVQEEDKLSSSLVEGGEQSVVPDNLFVEEGLGVNLNRVVEDQLDLVVVDGLLSGDVNLHHLLVVLLGEDVDVSASLAVVATSPLDHDVTAKVGLDLDAAAGNVSHFSFNLVVVDVPSVEDIGGNEEEGVGAASGVNIEGDHLLAFFVQFDVNQELGEQEVLVLFVHKDPDLILPHIEGTVGVVFVHQFVEDGLGVERHIGLQVQVECVGIVDGGPLSAVAPHAHSVLLAFDLELVSRVEEDSEVHLLLGVLINVGEGEFLVFKLHHDGALDDSSHDRVDGLGGILHVGGISFHLGVDLESLPVSLLEVNLDPEALGGLLSLHTASELFAGHSSVKTDSEVSVRPPQIEIRSGEFDVKHFGAVRFPDSDMGFLSGDSVNVDLNVPVLVLVDILQVELGLSVGHHVDLSVVDHGGNDGGRSVGSWSGHGLQVADPVVSFLVTEQFEGPLLHTVVIGMGQMVLDVQVEQAVSLADSSIKFQVDIDALAPGTREDSLHVINNDAQFSSLGFVGGILVLDTDVNSKHF